MAVFGAVEAQNAMAQNIVCLLPIEHADAEQLVSVLSPLLSPQETITAYSPTNTLIIKGTSSTVQTLVKVVKGRPDLSECDNWYLAPEN